MTGSSVQKQMSGSYTKCAIYARCPLIRGSANPVSIIRLRADAPRARLAGPHGVMQSSGRQRSTARDSRPICDQ